MNYMENIFLEIFGALLVIYSGYKLSVLHFYKKIEATCIEASCERIYSDGEPSLVYRGTFKYNYEKSEVISKDKGCLSKLEVGHKYVLYVNPKNPRKFVIKTELKYYVFLLIAGLIIMFLSPIFF